LVEFQPQQDNFTRKLSKERLKGIKIDQDLRVKISQVCSELDVDGFAAILLIQPCAAKVILQPTRIELR
jgi:magnesium chelatase subunit I